MKQSHFIEYLFALGITIGAILSALLVWWLVYNEPSPISYHGMHRVIPPIVKSGQLVVFEREFTIHRKTLLHIHRYAQTITADGITHTYDLPFSVSNKDIGTYKQERSIQLPNGMIPGSYDVKTKVCWQPNLIKTQCIDIPDVKFTVVP